MKKLRSDHEKTPAIYLDDIAVGQRYGVSRATPWRWVKQNNFPSPIRLTKGCTRWLISDLEKWEEQQKQSTK